MDEYIKCNKEAWEEAFENRKQGWGADVVKRAAAGTYQYFQAQAKSILMQKELRGKSVAQFCCNNGRELMSLVASSGAAEGTGFDIAQNQIQFARDCAAQAGLPCHFEAANILEIDEKYNGKFDYIIITVGVLCWFEKMDSFFAVVSRCLKIGGGVLISEMHPFENMLAAPCEDMYNPEYPLNCVYSYFNRRIEETDGMPYMTDKPYHSKLFVDFTHSLGEIMGAMCAAGMVIDGFYESDEDISDNFDNLSGQELPLSMHITGYRVK